MQENKSPSGQQPLTNSAQAARQNYQRLVELVKDGVIQGARIVRVHDVQGSVDVVRVIEALLEAEQARS